MQGLGRRRLGAQAAHQGAVGLQVELLQFISAHETVAVTVVYSQRQCESRGVFGPQDFVQAQQQFFQRYSDLFLWKCSFYTLDIFNFSFFFNLCFSSNFSFFFFFFFFFFFS